MTDLTQWLSRRSEERQRLYQIYAKPLEAERAGEYIAISYDGQTILGHVPGEVLKRAVDTFGSGNFVLSRIGHRTFGRWLRLDR